MRTWTEIEINLSLIRHGATKSNLEQRYLGKTEEALAAAGIKNLMCKKEAGSYPAVRYLFCSPMMRCRQTAGIIYPEMAAWEIPEWREIDFGVFEGRNYTELKGDPVYQEWIDSMGTLPFPKGESREQFTGRVMGGFDRMLSMLFLKEPFGNAGRRAYMGEIQIQEIGAVVHGGTIMALCSSLFGGDYFTYQAECGEGYCCRFRYTAEKTINLLEITKI